MHKKSTIGTVFIYAISAIIIVLIVYFGYRGISGIQKANEDAIMERMQLRMRADMSQISIRYGAIARFNYFVSPSYSAICFVDLFNESAGRNETLQNYPLVWDSVQSGSPNNAFATGEKTLAFDAGKLRVGCEPYVFCVNSTKGRISFLAEGGGDSVIITCTGISD